MPQRSHTLCFYTIRFPSFSSPAAMSTPAALFAVLSILVSLVSAFSSPDVFLRPRQSSEPSGLDGVSIPSQVRVSISIGVRSYTERYDDPLCSAYRRARPSNPPSPCVLISTLSSVVENDGPVARRL